MQHFDETPPFSPDPDGRAVDGHPQEGQGVPSVVEPAEKQQGMPPRAAAATTMIGRSPLAAWRWR
jgi:hypothetical protein